MKKRVVALMLALACSMSMAACGAAKEDAVNVEVSTASVEESTEESSVAESTAESSVEEVASSEPEVVEYETPADMSDDLWSFQLAINGELYQFPMWYSEFEAMGWTYEEDVTKELSNNQYVSRAQWTKDGVTAFTTIANLSMNTKTVKESAVSAIAFESLSHVDESWKIEMPKGIVFGISNKEDVVAAYGEPDSTQDSDWYEVLTYSKGWYETIKLFFDKETGSIFSIKYENIVELEDMDNSVNTETPDIVNQYTAPTAISEDLYGFDVKIDGNYYSFPCPVSELVKNGYTPIELKDSTEVAAGDWGIMTLEYKGMEFRYSAANYADYATTLENCFIYDFDATDYEKDVKIEVAHGITCGITEEELVSKLEGYDYERSDHGTAGISYRFYNRDDKYNGYIFDVDDGVVTRIAVLADWDSKQ